jgi:hypothetical protein
MLGHGERRVAAKHDELLQACLSEANWEIAVVSFLDPELWNEGDEVYPKTSGHS